MTPPFASAHRTPTAPPPPLLLLLSPFPLLPPSLPSSSPPSSSSSWPFAFRRPLLAPLALLPCCCPSPGPQPCRRPPPRNVRFHRASPLATRATRKGRRLSPRRASSRSHQQQHRADSTAARLHHLDPPPLATPHFHPDPRLSQHPRPPSDYARAIHSVCFVNQLLLCKTHKSILPCSFHYIP